MSRHSGNQSEDYNLNPPIVAWFIHSPALRGPTPWYMYLHVLRPSVSKLGLLTLVIYLKAFIQPFPCVSLVHRICTYIISCLGTQAARWYSPTLLTASGD